MYNTEEEKLKIYEMLSSSSVESHHYNKKKLLEDSLKFALDEYKELAISYDKFFQSIDHLVIYQELLKPKILRETTDMMKDLQVLIRKDYKKEELEAMPTPVYDQVLDLQRQRANLLKQIAKVYLSQKVKK